MKNERIDLGYISIHKTMTHRISLTDAYHALRRHELKEVQEGIPETLKKAGEKESQETGWYITYHVADSFEVFKVQTNPELGETRISPVID